MHGWRVFKSAIQSFFPSTAGAPAFFLLGGYAHLRVVARLEPGGVYSPPQ